MRRFSGGGAGRAPQGRLPAGVGGGLALHDDLDLCARVMGPVGLGRDGVAGLAPLVSDAAAQGDGAARAILVAAGSELAALASAVRMRLAFAPGVRVPVSLSGGVLQTPPLVR